MLKTTSSFVSSSVRMERPGCHWTDFHEIWYLRIFRKCVERYSKKLNSVALVRERTIPTERPPPVGEVSANICG
jgi:hypothetical protein